MINATQAFILFRKSNEDRIARTLQIISSQIEREARNGYDSTSVNVKDATVRGYIDEVVKVLENQGFSVNHTGFNLWINWG